MPLLDNIRTLAEVYRIPLHVWSVTVDHGINGTDIEVHVQQEDSDPVRVDPETEDYDDRVRALLDLVLVHTFLLYQDLNMVSVIVGGTEAGGYEGLQEPGGMRDAIQDSVEFLAWFLNQGPEEDGDLDDGDLNEVWDALAARREIAASLPVFPKDVLVKARENTPSQTWIDVLDQE